MIFIYKRKLHADGPGNSLLGLTKASASQMFTLVCEEITDHFLAVLPHNVEVIKFKFSWKDKLLIQRSKLLKTLKLHIGVSAVICWTHEGKERARFNNIFSNVTALKILMFHQPLSQLPYIKNDFTKINQQFDRFWFCGDDIRQDFLSGIGFSMEGRAFTIVNTVDSDAIRLSANKDTSPTKEFGRYLVAVAGLRPQKDFETAILGYAKSNAFERGIDFLIIGEGQQRQKLERLILMNNIKGVHLIGYIENPLPFIRGALAYLSSSLHEGLSMSVLEAAALSTPTILSDCTGNLELSSSGAMVYPRGDTDKLAWMIDNWILDENNYSILLKQSEGIKEYFNWGKVSSQLIVALS